MTLTRPQISKLIRLLGELQNQLECSIESNIVGDGGLMSGKPMAGDKKAAAELARDRRYWREAEAFVADLDRARQKSRARKSKARK